MAALWFNGILSPLWSWFQGLIPPSDIKPKEI